MKEIEVDINEIYSFACGLGYDNFMKMVLRLKSDFESFKNESIIIEQEKRREDNVIRTKTEDFVL